MSSLHCSPTPCPLLAHPAAYPKFTTDILVQEDVLRLVELTEDIKRDRRERIREIEAEREMADRQRRPLALPPPPWDEEKVIEREIIYDRGPPPRRYR